MKIIFLTILLAIGIECYAQNPLIIGESISLQSSILNETRVLNIYLPDGYQNSQKSYPVIYLLDGSVNEDFLHIAGLTQFLTMIEKMPESIVVGIANIDRRRDFTYPTTIKKDKQDFPTTGGSKYFILSLEQEIQPFVESHYRCTADKTLIGQSLGGLLALEILTKNAALFNKYLIVSPSLWWDNESLLGAFNDPNLSVAAAKIYIAVGAEGKVMEADTDKLYHLIQQKRPPAATLMLNRMLRETHATILHNGAYEGLIFLNAALKG